VTSVVVHLPRRGPALLLVPDLGHEHAPDQHVRAQIVPYPKFPGVRSPFAVLRDAVAGPAGSPTTPATSTTS
jgi:Xaa-Pro dipeptidase